MPYRIVYFGSPRFAVPSLRKLHADSRIDVELVVTQPDRHAGRGRHVVEPDVKSAARDLELEFWQPDTLRSDDAISHLLSLDPDLFVVVAYGEIFTRRMLAVPTHGCLNVHPSLLPSYRGSSPVPAAILNGDDVTGISIIEMVRRLDAGPVVAQETMSLSGNETGDTLSAQLADLAADMLPDVVCSWCEETLVSSPQDETLVSYTRELTKADGQIDWNFPANQIERMVRAYQSWPSAWSTLNGRRVVIRRAAVADGNAFGPPGQIDFENGAVLIACGSELLEVLEVQPQGKRRMPADAWFRGLRTKTAPRFESVTGGQ